MKFHLNLKNLCLWEASQVQTQVQSALEFALEMPPRCLPDVSQAQTQVQFTLEICTWISDSSVICTWICAWICTWICAWSLISKPKSIESYYMQFLMARIFILKLESIKPGSESVKIDRFGFTKCKSKCRSKCRSTSQHSEYPSTCFRWALWDYVLAMISLKPLLKQGLREYPNTWFT